ncbi:unnamed protein product, partial [Prorocentrum cordatum]
GFACALASYVDNLVAFGPSPEAATSIRIDCGVHLKHCWSLEFCQDSMEYMTCRGYPSNATPSGEWHQRTAFKCFGHHPDDDGGIATCLSFTIRSMWRAFWGNMSKGLQTAPIWTKLRFMQTFIKPILLRHSA